MFLCKEKRARSTGGQNKNGIKYIFHASYIEILLSNTDNGYETITLKTTIIKKLLK